MPIQAIQSISDEVKPLDRMTSLAFFSSLPVILPSLDALHLMLDTTAGQTLSSITENTTFIWTMLIAVMFTTLAILFICLLKTSYNRLGQALIRASCFAYLAGYFVLAAAGWYPDLPSSLLTAAGLPLGFGAAIICMTWFTRVKLRNYRAAFIALLIVFFTASVVNAGVLLIPPAIGTSVLFLLACVGSLGALFRFGQTRIGQCPPSIPGQNWWDVFGTFDLSLVEGSGDFKTPASRILFFVATPLTMLLLFVVNRSMDTALTGPYTDVLLGCLLVTPCAVPLLFIRSDQGLINASYRLYLPLMAFCVFVANGFVSQAADGIVIGVGIDVFCILYFLLIAAMITTMAGRMRSLALPAISILLIALSLVALLSFTKMNAGLLAGFQHYALMTLFVLASAMLLATPGAHMWRMMLEGVTQTENEIAATPSFMDRCKALAKEHSLTERETEILAYLGRGHGATYVSEILVVAESTVRSHRKNIYRKLGINSREELFELLDDDLHGPTSQLEDPTS